VWNIVALGTTADSWVRIAINLGDDGEVANAVVCRHDIGECDTLDAVETLSKRITVGKFRGLDTRVAVLGEMDQSRRCWAVVMVVVAKWC
jgi:hypothetical protein